MMKKLGKLLLVTGFVSLLSVGTAHADPMTTTITTTVTTTATTTVKESFKQSCVLTQKKHHRQSYNCWTNNGKRKIANPIKRVTLLQKLCKTELFNRNGLIACRKG